MNENNWQVLIELTGEIQAEMLCGLLEAQGISTTALFSSNSAYPVNPVQVLVSAKDLPQAQTVLQDYFAGKFNESEETEPTDRVDPADQG